MFVRLRPQAPRGRLRCGVLLNAKSDSGHDAWLTHATPRAPQSEFNTPINLDPLTHEGRFGSGTLNREFMAVG